MKKRIKNFYYKLSSTNIVSNFFNLSSIQISNVLLLLLTIRIITVVVGKDEFGIIMFASKFSLFAGAIINYGTNQSAVRDVAYNINDIKKLSSAFNNTLCIRVLIFLLYIITLITLQGFGIPYYSYIIFSIPLVLAEVFNPLCFFLGTEKLKIFNIYNLVFNIIAVLALIFFIKTVKDALWVNFILGTANVITYLGLLIYFGVLFKLSVRLPSKSELLKTGKDNFYLTINNVSANLQQSVITFALAKWSSADLLGAYSIGDRIIGQCRNLLNNVTNAMYPNAVNIYKQSAAMWSVYRRKTKYLLAGAAFIGAIIIFILADPIIYVLSKTHDENTIIILRIMAFVPVISAINVFSMLDMLLKNNTLYIFRVAMILLFIAALTATILSHIGNYLLIGSFTLIIELCAMLMYEYVIKKPSIQNV